MEKLTIQEKDAMKALWRLGKGTARQLLAAHAKPLPHYNTLRSTLENLAGKKYLAIRQVGNTNEYTSLIKESTYKKQFLSGFVKDHFSNSYKELVAFFAEQNELSEKDLEDIRDIIRNKRTR